MAKNPEKRDTRIGIDIEGFKRERNAITEGYAGG
jgi:hypothetical protein